MPNPRQKDERAAEYAQPIRRRKVGDVDPEGKAVFGAELKKLGRPGAVRIPSKTPPAAAMPETADNADKTSTYTKASGKLRTRKERIDYEVDQAS